MKTITIAFCIGLLLLSTGVTKVPARDIAHHPIAPTVDYQRVIEDINFWNETSRKADSIAKAAGITLK